MLSTKVFEVRNFQLSLVKDEKKAKTVVDKFQQSEESDWETYDEYYELDIIRGTKGYCLLWVDAPTITTKSHSCQGYCYVETRDENGCLETFFQWHANPRDSAFFISKYYDDYDGVHFTIEQIATRLIGYNGTVQVKDKGFKDKPNTMHFGQPMRENVEAIRHISIKA
jgi:hypothetical protein